MYIIILDYKRECNSYDLGDGLNMIENGIAWKSRHSHQARMRCNNWSKKEDCQHTDRRWTCGQQFSEVFL